jgi:DNA-binding GntR family transcriptional regulator
VPERTRELRVLLEVPAVRRLTDRGFSDEEFVLLRRMADESVRAARRGDVSGYVGADKAFHLYLIELIGDPALSEIVRLLGPVNAGDQMTRAAREHRELIDMLADDRVSAAEDLLRHHLSRPYVSRPHLSRPQLSRPSSGGSHDGRR